MWADVMLADLMAILEVLAEFYQWRATTTLLTVTTGQGCWRVSRHICA